jgi:DNA-binding NtrC family response regulator
MEHEVYIGNVSGDDFNELLDAAESRIVAVMRGMVIHGRKTRKDVAKAFGLKERTLYRLMAKHKQEKKDDSFRGS